jgi:hypothetical protein
MSVAELATNMMNYAVRIVLVLMCAGLAFMVLNQFFPAALPESELLFTVAVGALLATPLIVVFTIGVFFAYKKEFRMALVSFALFAALASGGVVYLLFG